MKKLTLISISFRGRQVSRFVHATMIRGKAVIGRRTVMSILEELGIGAGETFTIG